MKKPFWKKKKMMAGFKSNTLRKKIHSIIATRTATDSCANDCELPLSFALNEQRECGVR